MADATPLYRVRLAIRDELSDLAAGDKVLVAVSGGADSMALAVGLLQEAATLTIKPIAIVIDHDLQKESAAVAEHTKAKLIALGYQHVERVARPVVTLNKLLFGLVQALLCYQVASSLEHLVHCTSHSVEDGGLVHGFHVYRVPQN